jgi:hypothetical protein
VVIVGVRVRPGDSHIWQPLASTAARIVYCSGSAAGKEFQDWSNLTRSGRTDAILRGYFSDRFVDVIGALGLD